MARLVAQRFGQQVDALDLAPIRRGHEFDHGVQWDLRVRSLSPIDPGKVAQNDPQNALVPDDQHWVPLPLQLVNHHVQTRDHVQVRLTTGVPARTIRVHVRMSSMPTGS